MKIPKRLSGLAIIPRESRFGDCRLVDNRVDTTQQNV
jgi:hypothetical protein